MGGAIIATCGHKLEDGDDGREVIYWGEDCDSDGFHPCVFYSHYCTKCADKAREWPEFLPDHEAADRWLDEHSRPTPEDHRGLELQKRPLPVKGEGAVSRQVRG